MSKISSTTLFHFLKKKEWLYDILKNKEMSPRYVLENYPPINEKHLILMKCFCDIPLSNIINHTDTYGKFGIGLSKEFAVRNYISPVQYIHKESHPFYALMSIDFKETKDFYFLISHYKYMFSHDKKVNYYDEREWRYTDKETVNVTDKSDQEVRNEQEALNTNVDTTIKFKLSDIEYLFVGTKKEINLLANKIEGMNYNRTEKNSLLSKIISVEQIERDF